MTSALSVLTQPIPFTKYIFVDEDRDCLDALQQRVEDLGDSSKCTFIRCDVNASVDQVLAALPDWKTDGGVLTFCFIDPFKLDLSFEILRRLAHLRIDILLMIPLGYDLKRNWREYLDRAEMRERLSAFLGDDGWVDEWKRLGRPYREFPRFVQRHLGRTLESFGFQELEYRDIRDVKVAGMGVYLYSLHLFSKSKVAMKFWRNVLTGTSEQHSLGL